MKTHFPPFPISAIFLSLFVHVLFILIFHNFVFLPSNQLQEKPSPTVVEFIPPDLEKFRTVGTNEGKKDSHDIKPEPAKRRHITQTTQATQQKKLSELGQIRPENSSLFLKKNHLKDMAEKDLEKLKMEELENKEKMANSDMPRTLQDVNLSFKFERPEGVSFDELNQEEQVFYMFHVRTDTLYKSAIYRAYSQIKQKYPYFDFDTLSTPQRLVGRMTIDEKGNKVSVRFVKTTGVVPLDELFETTLDLMSMIPNPPKLLFKKSKQVSLYFQLVIL